MRCCNIASNRHTVKYVSNWHACMMQQQLQWLARPTLYIG